MPTAATEGHSNSNGEQRTPKRSEQKQEGAANKSSTEKKKTTKPPTLYKFISGTGEHNIGVFRHKNQD